MNGAICELFDNGKFDEIVQDEWPSVWSENTLYYNILDRCRTMNFYDLRRALNTAMTTWDFEVAVHFKPSWAYNEPADLKIFFKSSEEDELFNRKPSVLAYAYFPGQGNLDGIIVFNDDYIWTLNGKSIKAKDAYDKGWIDKFVDPDNQIRTYNLIQVLMHELGHSLGLKHDVSGNNDGSDVMDAFYDGTRHDLSERDIYRIRLKYPIRIFSRWLWYGRLKRWLAARKRRY